MKRSLREWDIFQLKLARHYSTMSRDPSTKVGAVVTDKDSKHVYGLGYNGFNSNTNDDYAYTLGRDYKINHTVHAEINALDRASRVATEDAYYQHKTLFVYPFICCSVCAASVANSWQDWDLRITRVVTLDYTPERWKDDFAKSEEILAKEGITVVKYRPDELGDNDGYRP